MMTIVFSRDQVTKKFLRNFLISDLISSTMLREIRDAKRLWFDRYHEMNESK